MATKKAKAKTAATVLFFRKSNLMLKDKASLVSVFSIEVAIHGWLCGILLAWVPVFCQREKVM